MKNPQVALYSIVEDGSFSFKTGRKIWMTAFSISIQHYIGSYNYSNYERKRNKKYPNWKEINKSISVCWWYNFLCKNFTNTHTKVLELKNSKKNRIQNQHRKISCFLYNNNEQFKRKLRKQFHSTKVI